MDRRSANLTTPGDAASGAPAFAVGLPNQHAYADPRLIADLAREAEASGWDAVFIWDTIAGPDWTVPATDPWIAIAAAAMATSQLRLGVMVTPLSRRRPWKVAREAAAVDILSEGRFHLGVGLGHEVATEFAAFGEETDPRVRAERLDEGLGILTGLLSGEPLSFSGRRFSVEATFTPVPVQPKLPIWVAGAWPNKRPFRRAARYDGVFPTRVGVGHTSMMPPEELAEVVSYVRAHRFDPAPFEVVYEGQSTGTDRVADAEKVCAYREAGLTWWVEKLGWFRGSVADVRKRISAGPPDARL